MQRTRTHYRLALKLDFNTLSSRMISFRETTHKCLLTLNILIVGDSVALSHLPDTIMVVYIHPVWENAPPSAVLYAVNRLEAGGACICVQMYIKALNTLPEEILKVALLQTQRRERYKVRLILSTPTRCAKHIGRGGNSRALTVCTYCYEV